MKARLIRLSEVDGKGTLGVLMLDDRPLFATLENPWKQNARNISCIPEGQYACKAYSSQRFGFTYKLVNVPNRSGIIIHAGNFPRDTRGCILLGMSWSINETDGPAIRRSQRAMDRFREETKNTQGFLLEIICTYDEQKQWSPSQSLP